MADELKTKRRLEIAHVQSLAIVQRQTGDIDSAIAALPYRLEVPNGIAIGGLQTDPIWDPLRKDPRFEKLVAQQ